MHFNSANDWNKYSKYFSQNTQAELDRFWKTGAQEDAIDMKCKGMSASDILLYTNDISAVTVCKQCYELFKKKYPETWQKILTKFEERTHYTEARKTVGQWQHLSVCNSIASTPNVTLVLCFVESTQHQSGIHNGRKHCQPRCLTGLFIHHAWCRGCTYIIHPLTINWYNYTYIVFHGALLLWHGCHNWSLQSTHLVSLPSTSISHSHVAMVLSATGHLWHVLQTCSIKTSQILRVKWGNAMMWDLTLST